VQTLTWNRLRTAWAHQRWRIALSLAVTETISYGILYYAFSVFLKPMEAELGWTRAELTGAFSLSFLVMAAMAYPVGLWVDRHGPRALMTIGSIGASALVIAWSRATHLIELYVIWAGIGVCAAAVLYEPAFAVIAQWFRRDRGAALTLVTLAAGFASTIFIPLADALLGAFGWRAAVLGLGVFLGCATVPLHALVLRRRPDTLEAADLPPDSPGLLDVAFGHALRDRTFWVLTVSFGLSSLSAAAIRLHFIPYLIDTGIAPGLAALATGAIGVAQVLGRLLFVPLDHRLTSRQIAVGVLGLQTVAHALLLTGASAIALGGFVLLFGAAQGAGTLVRPAMLAERYGSRHYGRISSVMAMILTVTATVSPWAASLLYDQLRSYTVVLWLILGLAVVATGVLGLTRAERISPSVVSTAD